MVEFKNNTFKLFVLFVLIIYTLIAAARLCNYVLYHNRQSNHTLHLWPYCETKINFLLSSIGTIIIVDYIGDSFIGIPYYIIISVLIPYYVVKFIYAFKLKY